MSFEGSATRPRTARLARAGDDWDDPEVDEADDDLDDPDDDRDSEDDDTA